VQAVLDDTIINNTALSKNLFLTDSGYTEMIIYSLEFTAFNLKLLGFSDIEIVTSVLTDGNKTPSAKKTFLTADNAYEAATVYSLNFTAIQLKTLGFSDKEIVTSVLDDTKINTITAAKNAFLTANGAYTAATVYSLNFTASQLKTLGFFGTEIVTFVLNDETKIPSVKKTFLTSDNVYTAATVYSLNFTALQLKTLDFPDKEIVTFVLNDTKKSSSAKNAFLTANGAYTAEDVYSLNFTASQLKTFGFSGYDIVKAVLDDKKKTPSDKKLFLVTGGAYLGAAVYALRFTALDLNNLGFAPAKDIVNAVLNDKTTTDSYKKTFFSDDKNYTASAVYLLGFTVLQLQTLGFSDNDIVKAVLDDTKKSSSAKKTFLTAGNAYTVANVYSLGFTASQLKTLGFSGIDIVNSVLTDGSKSDSDKYTFLTADNAYTVANVYSSGFTALQLKKLGFSDNDIVNSVLNDTSKTLSAKYTFLTAGNAYTAENVYSLDFTVFQLINLGFSNTSIINIILNDLNAFSHEGVLTNTEYGLITTYSNLMRYYNFTDSIVLNFILNDATIKSTVTNTNTYAVILTNYGYLEQDVYNANYSVSQLQNYGFDSFSIIQSIINDQANILKVQLGNATFASILTGYNYNITFFITFFTSNESFKPLQLRNWGFSDIDIIQGGFDISLLSGVNSAGYTPSDLKIVPAYAASILSSGAYTVLQLKGYGYLPGQIKQYSSLYSDQQILSAGFNVTDLRYYQGNLLYNASSLQVYYTPTELSNGGYNASEILSAGYSATILKGSGFTVKQLQTANYNKMQILSAGFSPIDLKSGNYSVIDLYNANYLVTELLTGTYTVSEIINAHCYSVSVLRTITDSFGNQVFTAELLYTTYSASELKGYYDDNVILPIGYSVQQLYDAGYQAYELLPYIVTPYNMLYFPTNLKGIYSDTNILSAGFSPINLKSAGYSVLDLYNANYLVTELLTGTYTVSEIINAHSYSVATLRTVTDSNGIQVFTAELLYSAYSASELKGYYSNINVLNLDYTINDLYDAGYQINELLPYIDQPYNKSYFPINLKGIYSDTNILSAGFNAIDLKSAGYSVLDLYNVNYSVGSLLTGTYTVSEIINAHCYSVSTLRTVTDSNGMQIFTAELLYSNYSASELKGYYDDNVVLSLGYSVQQLYNAGYLVLVLKSYTTLKPIDLKGIYDNPSILGAGFTVVDLKLAGYLVKDLYSANYLVESLLGKYTIEEIIEGHCYSIATLYQITNLDGTQIFTAQLLKNSYSASELRGYYYTTTISLGYTAQNLYDAGYEAFELVGYYLPIHLKGIYPDYYILSAGFSLSDLTAAGLSYD